VRMHSSNASVCPLPLKTSGHPRCYPQGLAVGFVLLRVESLAEEGKL